MADKTISRISRRRTAAQHDGSAEYAAKRAELIRIAAQVFYEKGYASATLSDIAEVFGTDRASLYYYVGGKEELLREAVTGLVERRIEEAEAVCEGATPPREKLRLLIQIIVGSQIENYPALQVFIRESATRVATYTAALAEALIGLSRRLETCFVRTVQEGVDTGALRRDLPASLITQALLGSLFSMYRWYRPGLEHDADAVADTFEKLFLEGAAG